MARATKEEALKTRDRILETAIRLFYRNGVSATTLDNIAESAGLTRGAIYWHFKNKLDLITAIHDQLHLSITETMLETLKNPALPPLARIRTAGHEFLDSIEAGTQRRMVLATFLLRCDYSGEMHSFLESQRIARYEGLKMFMACFAEAQEAGEIAADANPEMLAEALFCLLVGILHEDIRGRDFTAMERKTFFDYGFSGLTLTHKPT